MKQVKNKSTYESEFQRGKYFLSLLLVSFVHFAFSPLSAQQLNEDKMAKTKLPAEQEEVNTLDGKQKRHYVTAAISQIDASTIADDPIINNTLKTAGHLSGLTIFQSNGEPGAEKAKALIRGRRTLRDNDPVVLVDGFERDFSLLDPHEIETITVLKDAAATALYGLRGGNGVILITTRRGKEGKIKINFNASAGVKEATTRPRFLNSYDYASLYNEAEFNDYNDGSRTPTELAAFKPTYSTAVLEKYRKAASGIYEEALDPYLYPDINWYNDYVKKSTWQQHYNVNANGGNRYATYFISVGYTTSSGLFNVDKSANTYNTNADMNMFTVRSNVDIRPTERLLISLDLSARQEERTNPGLTKDFSSRIFGAVYRTPPNAHPALNPDGSPAGTKDYTNNPYGLLNLQGYSLYFIRNMFANTKVSHDLDFITKGLRVEGAFAFDSWYDQETNRSKKFKVYSINTETQEDGTRIPLYGKNGELSYGETGSDEEMDGGGSYPGTLRVFSWKFKLDYEKAWKSHYLYGMLGYSQRTLEQEKDSNLPRQYLGMSSRIAYAWKNRYLAEMNMGYEGSEQMPDHNKFGFFPAFSAGWVLSEEDFLKNNNLINFLKIRGSYGVSGNDDTGGYFAYIQRFNKATGNTFGTSLSGQDGWEESAIAQKDVTWEKVRKSNIGIDASLLQRRMNLSLDLFMEKNRDIMVDAPLPLLMGTKVPLMPLGKVNNKGLELSASWSDKIGNLNYEISGVYSTSRNKVIDKAEITPLYDYQRQTGLAMNPAFGFEVIGYYTEEDIKNGNLPSQSEYGTVRPGDLKYKDQNGDNVINEYDKVYLGPKDIHSQASLNLSLAYKGFDFSIQFLGQWGGSMSLNNEAAYEFYNNGGVSRHHLNRYNPADPDSYVNQGMKFYKGDYPRLTLADNNNRQESTFWRVPTDLLRLKNAELGYTLKKEWLQKANIEKLRLYVNGFNLYTWSHSDLIDIESGSGSGMVYPIQRIFNFGVNLSF